LGIAEVVSAPASPWQNPYVERLIGSIRRECLDHVIVVNEAHLRRVLTAYSRYIIGVEHTWGSRKTRPNTDRSLDDPPGRSSRSPKSAVSTTAMSGVPRRNLPFPPAHRLACQRSRVKHPSLSVRSL